MSCVRLLLPPPLAMKANTAAWREGRRKEGTPPTHTAPARPPRPGKKEVRYQGLFSRSCSNTSVYSDRLVF